MDGFLLKEETYQLVGRCMEVHNTLGFGFSETVYKDAIELELIKANLLYTREAQLNVSYKGITLKHKFFADFICFENLIVEVKSCADGILDEHIAQLLNYLRVSDIKVGLIVNFGKRKMEYKRLIL